MFADSLTSGQARDLMPQGGQLNDQTTNETRIDAGGSSLSLSTAHFAFGGVCYMSDDEGDDETVAVDLRTVTITGNSALISIPGADRTIADGGSRDELNAQIEVTDAGDRWRVEAVIDKPDDDDLTNEIPEPSGD